MDNRFEHLESDPPLSVAGQMANWLFSMPPDTLVAFADNATELCQRELALFGPAGVARMYMAEPVSSDPFVWRDMANSALEIRGINPADGNLTLG